MILWRIATETRQFQANDLSGAGAARSPGRWNEEGQAIVYCAPSIALAVLETAAHIHDGGLPLNRYLVRIEVPAAIWRRRRTLEAANLPPTWNAIPAGSASARIGGDWLRSQGSTLLLAPSVIVPEEPVALINPMHPDASRITVVVERAFEYGKLFRRA